MVYESLVFHRKVVETHTSYHHAPYFRNVIHIGNWSEDNLHKKIICIEQRLAHRTCECALHSLKKVSTCKTQDIVARLCTHIHEIPFHNLQ